MALDLDKIVTAENQTEERVSSAKKELAMELAAAKEQAESKVREAGDSAKMLVANAIERGRSDATAEAGKLHSAQGAAIVALGKSAEAKASKAIQAITEVF